MSSIRWAGQGSHEPAAAAGALQDRLWVRLATSVAGLDGRTRRALVLAGPALLTIALATAVVQGTEREVSVAWVVAAVAALVGWSVMALWLGRSVDLLREALSREAEHRGTADVLQRSLLPAPLPDVPGVRLAARCLPGKQGVHVGGDWYDVIPLATGELGLVVGDVAGHDLSAVAAMNQLRITLRAYALEDRSPASVLRRVNRAAMSLDLTDMATCIYGVLDPRTLTLRWASAGHLPPVVASGSARGRLLTHDPGAPLGSQDGAEYEDHAVTLVPGQSVLLYSDGLVERRGTSIDVGLAALVAARKPHPCPDVLCDTLLTDRLDDSARDDDVTLLLVQT